MAFSGEDTSAKVTDWLFARLRAALGLGVPEFALVAEARAFWASSNWLWTFRYCRNKIHSGLG